jgi:hypothetical protein
VPIRAELRHHYHGPHWEFVRLRIHARAAGRCECRGECGEAHHCDARAGDALPCGWPVVLACAHLNHCPGDNRDSNLLLLCQPCHLRHDAELHQRNASRTRRLKRNNLDLFPSL